MPGYGFSERASTPGMDAERIAALWAELMTGLGYARFGAQGGDWGSMVSTYLGANHAAHVLGVHLNMVIALPPDPYIAGVLAAAALHVFDIRLMADNLTFLLLAALAAYAVLFAALQWLKPDKAHLYAATFVATALGIYWLWFDHALH